MEPAAVIRDQADQRGRLRSTSVDNGCFCSGTAASLSYGKNTLSRANCPVTHEAQLHCSVRADAGSYAPPSTTAATAPMTLHSSAVCQL